MNKVPKKYEGLDGTELAISESQERMAVVLDPKDVEEFCKKAAEENLDAQVVAIVTEEPRLKMEWRGDQVVNLSRAFLDTNGVTQNAEAQITAPQGQRLPEVRARLSGGQRGHRGPEGQYGPVGSVLPEGPFRAVRRQHRRRHRADALCRQVPADSGRGHGGQDPPAPRGKPTTPPP